MKEFLPIILGSVLGWFLADLIIEARNRRNEPERIEVLERRIEALEAKLP